MNTSFRMTHSTALVLQRLAAGGRYGFEIMEATGLAGGTVYPALRRLEAAGLAESRWEDAEAAQTRGRPARKYYRITARGSAALEQAARRYHVLRRLGATVQAER